MEVIKKSIYMNKLKCKSNLQITLDDDINVPDIKPDMFSIIKEQGNIFIEEIKPMNGKLSVRGKVEFNLLYLSDESGSLVHNISGKILFDEIVNMNDSCMTDDPFIKCSLDDLSTTIINSRKLRVNAIISLDISVEESIDQEAIVDIKADDTINFLKRKIEITNIKENKKDTYRIKNEVQIPSSKENISELLYSEVDVNAVEIRLLDDKFTIKGELPLFIVYKSDNDESAINYYETVLSFSDIIECSGCNEEMIEDISYHILTKGVSIREDLDGEDRILEVELVLGLNIKIYEMEEIELLYDLYSPCKEVSPIYENASYENLIVKNNSKHRINDRIQVMEKQAKILQICHGSGQVKVDDITLDNNELRVEGLIEVNILYISEDDSRPLNSIKGMIPFAQSIEVSGIKENSIYDVKASLDQLSVIMLDGDELEIKAIINLNTIVFDNISEKVISQIEVDDLDKAKFMQIPGLVAYIVKDGDSLWNIAKRYYTTIEALQELNNLEGEEIDKGSKILVMKNILSK